MSLLRAPEETCRAEWRDIRGADEAARYRRFEIAMRSLRPPGYVPSTPETAEEKSPLDIVPAVEDLTLHELAVVEYYDLPIEQVGTPLFEIAEVMHRWKFEYWGFMVFRTCGYGSGQARWDEFWRRWVRMMNDRLGGLAMDGIFSTGLQEDDEGFETRFQEMYGDAMAGGILPRFRLQVNEYEGMSGWGPQEVRGLFREILKTEEEGMGDDSKPNKVPLGVDWDLCLMVDEGVVSSLLDEREGRRPYIIGVLSDINEKEIGDDIEALHFKIGLESVVDLWRQVQLQHPSELMLEGSEGKIYISPGVFEDGG